jgi:hypothetical protein
MSGLFRRLSSRRSGGPEGNEPQTAAQPGATDAPATTPAEPGGHQSLLTDPAAETRIMPGAAVGSEPTPAPQPAAPAPQPVAPAVGVTPAQPVPEPVPVADLPAGLDPDELAAAPGTSARRGKLRRRIAFLRAAREVLLRDLGGFVYELHRTAHDLEADAHRRLRETKLTRLERVDAELHDLEYRLDDVRRQVLVREPGVGGECPECGELFGSAAHYCWHCGLPLTESARKAAERAKQPEPLPDPVIAPAPAAATDQPTQEIPPLDPDHPSAGGEFQWPRRGDADKDSWTSEPTGEAAPTAADETAGDEPRASGDGAAADDAAAAGGAPRAGADETPSDGPATDASEQAATGEAAAREEAATGETAAREEGGETAASGDASPASGEPPAGDAPRGETATGEVPSGGDAPHGERPADDSPNGSVFSPVERRP